MSEQQRRPVELLMRADPSPDDDVVVVRGGPISADKIVEHARRQQALFTYRGEPMAAVSADLAVPGWSVDRILRERMWSRGRYATTTVGSLRAAGFDLVPTGQVPHFSVVLRSASHADAVVLLAQFGPTLENPYRARR